MTCCRPTSEATPILMAEMEACVERCHTQRHTSPFSFRNHLIFLASRSSPAWLENPRVAGSIPALGTPETPLLAGFFRWGGCPGGAAGSRAQPETINGAAGTGAKFCLQGGEESSVSRRRDRLYRQRMGLAPACSSNSASAHSRWRARRPSQGGGAEVRLQ